MVRFLRRLVVLLAVGAAAAFVARWWSARSVPAPAATPQWPPFERPASTTPSHVPTESTTDESTTDESTTDESTTDESTTDESTGNDRAPAPVQAFVAASSDTIEVPVRPSWVLPVDGQCPPGYPVKANDNSGIFHVPGGRSYERTKPERCYVDAESAAADGYRAAKA